ncbi:Na+/H+ antiporter NhaA [Nocardioides sp. MAH-18]|uniref:Na(+)/H(+) antiporter NhaA n=1 Tax=Nocardioides agri TaxID=2682843 RepID=A0A6L6XXM3_9ACTN|nr:MULTISPECIES: Na+/H+ antiporter NhaA [unclassified Nocardioides]MBA2955395.1 Na+/H+ antiporter NhaA [Nocardioides sp. CGMCC 1.13656]MVQ50245.1 Na+/H+ antiporter NhaA [Nocardioides sp. MAH-18]
MSDQPQGSRLFSRGSWLETSRTAEVLRAETTGGLLLIVAAVVALVWANSPWHASYADLRDLVVGPEALHLDLSLGAWAADGLLAIFFFVAGLELKREFVAGDLRDPRRAVLPVVAAVAGMVVPALVYVAINLGSDDLVGWAIPTATDIAFALAILAVINTHLPSGLRTFLLALAVVDDLLAITVIAVFYTDDLHLLWLAAAAVPIAAFAALARRDHGAWLLVPLGLVAWTFVHSSGVHATVAGVLLGFMIPVRRAHAVEHVVRPISAGVAVPLFAFFSAGVYVGGLDGLIEAETDPIAVGIVVGLVLGKTVGITGATWLLARFTRADLDDDLAWADVLGMSMLAGVGFTVSLLISELAFGAGTTAEEHAKVGVLTGSLLAALLAAVVLRSRNRAYRRICELEERDDDGDGIPDVFQRGDGTR